MGRWLEMKLLEMKLAENEARRKMKNDQRW
jgi:hypothetical protein